MPRQDTFTLRQLLESGLLGVNEAAPWLHQAIVQEDQETVSILLQHKVDPEACYTKTGRALDIAAATGNTAIFELLLKNGAVVNTKVLHFAVVQGYAQLVELLFRNGAELLETDPGKGALLHIAASGGHHNVIESLLRHGADIDYISPDMSSVLHCAAANGHYKAVQVLLENDADTFVLGPEKRTALETAAEAGHVQVFQLLLEKTLRTNNTPFRSALNIAAALRVDMFKPSNACLRVGREFYNYRELAV
jgi:ankyrin repeat protein